MLRAINAGVALPMADLRRIAVEAGLANPRTYIASGNLLFDSPIPDAEARQLLEAGLAAHTGKPIWLTLRTGAELAALTAANPFPDHPGNRVFVTFLHADPPPDALAQARHRSDEQLALGPRAIIVHYPTGLGHSRLVIPALKAGTARNMNTVAKLAELARGS
ncbi:DUF1697 domain-containing protein [Sphingomonas sp. BN140010]|uniref:DUF1697 domain-containing protein n=1 Tax=Sphingomonas arvum TaxID=2992113 RepID=A0ABT3JHN7_9SPHN|nr:DUF1697 domain-containing protein [Sphingomonas sp. BN140010]